MEPWRALRSNVLHFGTGQAGWLHVPRKAHREREQKLDTWNAFFFLKSPAYVSADPYVTSLGKGGKEAGAKVISTRGHGVHCFSDWIAHFRACSSLFLI